MGRSTGLVFAHFPDKESLWREAMGTPPPIDSALTRAAPLLLSALEALVDQHACPDAEASDLWIEAADAIRLAYKADPGGTPPSILRRNDDPSQRLSRFSADVIAEVEDRRTLPQWKSLMEPVFELCGLLMAYAEHKSSEAEVYDAAVSACATITQVGVHGASDVPYRLAAAMQRERLAPETKPLALVSDRQRR